MVTSTPDSRRPCTLSWNFENSSPERISTAKQILSVFGAAVLIRPEKLAKSSGGILSMQ